MIVYRGGRKTTIDFDLIEGLEIREYRPALSRVTMPTMFIKMKNGDEKKFYYGFYSRETINEIIQTVLKRNNLITLDEKNKELMELYKSIHLSSFNAYGSLEGQVVYKVTPKIIKLWKYINGTPIRQNLYVHEKIAEQLDFM